MGEGVSQRPLTQCEGHGTKVPFMGSGMENVLLPKMEPRGTC